MEMVQPEQYEGGWHLDKKVPVALICTLVVQTITIVWWSATMTARVDQLERQSLSIAPQAERIIRLETKVDTIGANIGELKTLIERRDR